MKLTVLINDLIDEHGDTFTTCEGCGICKKIENIREKLSRPNNYVQQILAKGQDMTKSDIKRLLEDGVQRSSIQSALKMGAHQFIDMMVRWGFDTGKRIKPHASTFTEEMYLELKNTGMTDVEIAEQQNIPLPTFKAIKKRWKDGIPVKRKISEEMYLDLKAKGLKGKEIAEKFGITPVTLSGYKKRWKEAREYQETKEEVKEKLANDAGLEAILKDKIAELEKQVELYPSLEKRAAKLDIQNMELEDELAYKNKRIEELNQAAEDTECELDQWREKAHLWKKEHDAINSAYITLREVEKNTKEQNSILKAALKAVL